MDIVAAERPQAVQSELAERFMAAGFPAAAAVFQTEVTGRGLEMFLSPEAADLAEDLITQWRGEPCEQPDVARLKLVVGTRDATERLSRGGHPG